MLAFRFFCKVNLGTRNSNGKIPNVAYRKINLSACSNNIDLIPSPVYIVRTWWSLTMRELFKVKKIWWKQRIWYYIITLWSASTYFYPFHCIVFSTFIVEDTYIIICARFGVQWKIISNYFECSSRKIVIIIELKSLQSIWYEKNPCDNYYTW